jgi:TrmH family RNA methyltransferase
MLPREITSLQHPIVKRLVKLREDRAFRWNEGSALIVGHKMVSEISPLKILIADHDPSPLSADEIYLATPEILKKITGVVSPEGIAAEVALPKPADLSRAERIVAFDRITDPGNIGSLLRSALALGFDGAFFLDSSADPFNDKALRAAKGATFRIPLGFGTEDDLEKLSRGRTTLIADTSGDKKIDSKTPLLLILGSESHGPSERLKKLGRQITIPMPGAMESLGVAAAGAILLYTLRNPS